MEALNKSARRCRKRSPERRQPKEALFSVNQYVGIHEDAPQDVPLGHFEHRAMLRSKSPRDAVMRLHSTYSELL